MKLLSRRFGLGILLALFAQVAYLPSAHAGAWNKPQWGFFLQLGSSFNFTDGQVARFNATGDRTGIVVGRNCGSDCRGVTTGTNTSNYQSLMTDLYWELALLDRLSFFGDISYISARQANGPSTDGAGVTTPGGTINYHADGLGDMLLGARVSILERPVAFALEGRLFVPLGDATKIVPTGSGDFRGEMRLALGKAWNAAIPVYVEAEAGVMFRGRATIRSTSVSDIVDGTNYRTTINYAPEIVAHAEIGVTAVRSDHNKMDRLILSLGVEYRGSTRRSDEPSFTLTPETQEFTMVNLNVMAFLWKGIGISLRGNQVVEGRRALLMTSVFGGLFASF